MKMKGKFYIETYGCQMNFHDSEKMATILINDEYKPSNSFDDADIYILNTCSVREKPEHKVYTLLGRLRKKKEKNPDLIVIVAGCVAQQEGDKLLRKNNLIDIIIGPKNISELPDLIDRYKNSRNGKLVSLSSAKQKPSFDICNIKRISKVKAYITIMEGCNKFCSYCIVPFTRGREIYRDYNEILNEARLLAEEGYKEICLLGQNVNSYVYNNYTFSDILENISKIKGIERIRFITSYPKDFDIKIVKLMKDNPSICPYLHLPVQSGSNKVLERMKRGYTREEYIRLIDLIKDNIPNIALSTDIIVGFPGETDEDFMQTYELVSYVEFIMMYSFKYSPRPYTYALKYKDDVLPEIKKNRLDLIQNLQRNIQERKFKSFINTKKEILVEGYSKRSSVELTGRTIENIIVNFSGSPELIGKIVSVEITEAYSNSLRGREIHS